MNEQISYINRTTDSLQNIFTIKLDSLIDAYFRGKGIEPPQNRNGEIPSEVLYEQLPAIAAQKNVGKFFPDTTTMHWDNISSCTHTFIPPM